ncbi:Putative iroquois-class homeodomain irx-1 [Gossypium arboreum]|uniref:Putative iroquois-class homeodomain irx-1 n=1 Tax=Gossypium arboreum TaxID=29729 RepID=A0A0B0N9X3_GOSAR|nr:Putative iroquois-class homeodomain irx-1 [Gossypium arboreum]
MRIGNDIVTQQSEARVLARAYVVRTGEEGDAHDVVTGEHRRVKGTRNGPKIEKMGQCTKSTRPGLPRTGRPHGRVPLARGGSGGSKELLKESRSIHLRSRIHHQD